MSLSLVLGAQLLPSPFFVRAAAAAELSEIRDRGYLIVAVKNNRPPLGFIAEDGELSGFEIDIARRLAEVLLGDASALRLVPVRNSDRLNAVIEDRVDIAIAAITITEPRRRIISFSDPYYLDGVAFVTPNPSIQQLPDLRSATIALLDRSSTVAHVRYILPGSRLVAVDSYAEGRSLLDSGAADAFAGDVSVLSGWSFDQRLASAQDQPTGEYRLLPSIISAEPLSVAIPKGTQYAPSGSRSIRPCDNGTKKGGCKKERSLGVYRGRQLNLWIYRRQCLSKDLKPC
ncbi:MAG: transporter substrate-binding domain-containing protein, partial [Phormidesmis sp.]